jgi:hypothetical protein
MKIVKEFSDLEFFRKRYRGNFYSQQDMWLWGLGENGELYCRCSTFAEGKWYPSDDIPYLNLSIADMKRITKEFGHLLVIL